MIKYAVRQTHRATDNNPNYAGQTAISWYGKAQQMLGYQGDHAEAVHMAVDDERIRFMASLYGYDRECDARRSWVFKNPDQSGFWCTVENEIVAIEC